MGSRSGFPSSSRQPDLRRSSSHVGKLAPVFACADDRGEPCSEMFDGAGRNRSRIRVPSCTTGCIAANASALSQGEPSRSVSCQWNATGDGSLLLRPSELTVGRRASATKPLISSPSCTRKPCHTAAASCPSWVMILDAIIWLIGSRFPAHLGAQPAQVATDFGQGFALAELVEM